MGIGSSASSAHLCQQLFIGQGVGFALSPGGLSACPGGQPYLSFIYDGTSAYEVEAGTILLPSGDPGTAVVLNTTSFGSITQDGFSGADQVEGITDQTSVTVTTAENEVTFAFDGLDLTITQFDAL